MPRQAAKSQRLSFAAIERTRSTARRIARTGPSIPLDFGTPTAVLQRHKRGDKAMRGRDLVWVMIPILLLGGGPALADEPIKVGLVAALSGGSAKSGEGITRGLSVAIDELNGSGGLLGRKIELVRRDDESNPSKGQ